MNAGKLAKLADLKLALGQSATTNNDAQLTWLLQAASGLAEQFAGLAPGSLRRQLAITEYPFDPSGGEESRSLRLGCRPVESITSLKQLYIPGSDADFAAQEALTEFEEWMLASADLGRVERIVASWYRRFRCIQAVYTAGYVDPARIEVALTTATWTASTKTLTQTGAFTGYTFAPGDVIVVTGAPGSGAIAGIYQVASKTSNDAIVLTTALSAGGNLSGVTSAYTGMILPPDDLQHAVIQQAVLMWNTRDQAGIQQINYGEAGGSFTTQPMKPHPALVAAVQRHKTLL